MKSATIRLYQQLHTWTGIVAGFALFIAFYAGAITVFHEDIAVWQSPATRNAPIERIDDAGQRIAAFHATHPELKGQFAMMLPSHHDPALTAWWFDAGTGAWQHRALAQIEQGRPPAPQADLAELVNELHFSLGLPVAGIWLMGIVSLLYGLALVSGLLVHLPLLAKDLFALRPGRNLKRFWQDAHNVIGVLSLPFHLMFAVTGAVFCLYGVVFALFNYGVTEGKLATEFEPATSAVVTRPLAGQPAAMLDPVTLLARVRTVAPDMEANWLRYINYGDRNATVEVRGASPDTLGPYGGVGVDMVSGEVLKSEVPGQRTVNQAVLGDTYGLHFGSFGGRLVQWLYFVLGLAGAFLFYSGNLLWIEARRKRQAPAQQLKTWRMAQATVGVCIGSCAAVSAAFVATMVAHAFGADPAVWARVACFASFALLLLWSFLRPPARAAFELLSVAALLSALIPLSNGIATGDHLFVTAVRGEWVVFGIDAMGLGLAAGFAALARATRRRARDGQANSVWAGAAPPAMA
ncbi:PepSY-associated TM helix domain-containing protein [Jeongeupia naejangsanensis]|uniref:PepSY domain-containing protein n=1 Tax=Jeongeupia naejangsanensis TaxID=613195 RepID=A0ABS2BR02_9NEIS|nr:PepSY-associated TM helix domain-containing protein [Jeongeupia naejangsanensis]MBM3117488.1 PepSY domain-containing protein [Jeongeupia naejangsanensis]